MTNNKKTIKIGLFGFWPTFSIFTSNYIWCKYLRNNYNIVVTDNPDYLLVNTMGDAYDFLKQKCKVRILITRENLTPDFNLFDYAVTPYPITFLDRHFYYPQFLQTPYDPKDLINGFKFCTIDDLRKKDRFANFIFSHDSRDNERSIFFELLSNYKKVDSVGTYLNNQEDKYRVIHINSTKTDFQKRCKFTICFESVNQYGFATEKITDAIYSRTIPIYCGSKTIYDVFNKSSIIDVSDYDSYEDVVNKIIELDNNDDAYLNMLNVSPIINPQFILEMNNNICSFFKNIFDQPVEKAIRRSNYLMEKKFTNAVTNIVRYKRAISLLSLPHRFVAKIRRISKHHSFH